MYVFIINPKAGNGRGLKIVEDYLKENKNIKNQCKTFYTEYEGHAEKLAEQIAEIYEANIKLLFVVGGDGTLFEVINGIKKYPRIPFSFVPVGSGNDFARGCQTSLDPKEHIVQSIEKGILNPYWLGTYRTNFKNFKHHNLFASSLGFGFDAEVAERVNRSRFKKILNRLKLTSIIYIFGLIVTVFIYKPKNITLKTDQKERQLTNVWMLTVSNHPYFGGGMKIAPNATINKEHFTLTIVHNIPRWKLLIMFMTVFFGTHTKLKEVEQFTATELKISSNESITFHADGATGDCYFCSVEKESSTRLVVRE
ncbi:diacylglycerol/lipid kinase family protein [Bacillaceae bacterium W0354]